MAVTAMQDFGPEVCADCPRFAQTAWSPIWFVYLCPECRRVRTEQDLQATREQNKL